MNVGGGTFSSLNRRVASNRAGGANAAVRLEVFDDDGVIAEMEAAPGDAARILNVVLWQAAQFIRRIIVDWIRKPPKTGRLYAKGKKTKKGTRVMHRASAPGQWPAADTGKLMRGVQQHRASDAPFAVDIESTEAYGAALEGKLPEKGGRPFMSRGFEEGQEGAYAIILQGLQNLFPANRKATRS